MSGSGQGRLSDEQLKQITDAVVAAQGAAHDHCRFNGIEANDLHSLAGLLSNGGLDNFRQLLEFGSALRSARKAGWIAFWGAVGLALLRILWIGFVERVNRGG